MEIGVEKHRGYLTADRQRNVEHVIGLIPLDSIFSPIRKVNFSVDDTRVGQSVDYDRLTLEIETNGSITPDDALATAAQIMQDQLDLFTGFNAEESPGRDRPDIGVGRSGRDAEPLRPLVQLSQAGRNLEDLRTAGHDRGRDHQDA